MIPETPVLTEEDVLTHLRAILDHGWGQMRIVVTEHYIKIVEPTPTLLGRKPDGPVRSP